jgi:pimeloyl-ACP methyl ester carboxylesterase
MDEPHVTIALLGLVLALAAAGAIYQWAGGRRAARIHPPPGTMVRAGDRRLHVVCAGSGQPPVLFESGIAATSLSWTRILPQVAAFTRACAYDRAGLGWSDATTAPTFAGIVDDLYAAMAGSGLSAPCVLVGHSFGCFIVGAFAARHAEKTAGLVLLDPPSAEWQAPAGRQAHLLSGGVFLSAVGGLLARVGVVRACGGLVLRGAPAGPRAFLRMFGPTAAATIERLVGEIGKLPAEVHPIVRAHWSQPRCFKSLAGHLRVVREAAAAFAATRPSRDLPIVVVSSGRLPRERIEEHRRLAALSSSGRHVIAEQSGHWIQFDQPDLVVRTIAQVVREVQHNPPLEPSPISPT